MSLGSVVCQLAPGAGNPRNSEGAFLTLKDGRILFVFSRYCGDTWLDHASADLAAITSDDGVPGYPAHTRTPASRAAWANA